MSEAGKPKIRLGEALVQRGAMTEEQVKEVLIKQRERSGLDKLFGELAVELHFVNPEMIEDILNQESS